MSDLTRDQVESFIKDLDIEIARFKGEVRARKNVRRFLRKMLRKTGRPINSRAKSSTGNGGSNAPLDSAPASGEVSRASDGAGTVASIHETAPPSEGHEGQETQERIPESDGRSEGSVSPLQRSSGVGAQPPNSLQAKPSSSRTAGAPHSPEAAPEIAAARARKPSLDGAEPVRQAGGGRAGEAARAPASPAADHAAFAEVGETISEALAGIDGNAGKSGGPSGSPAPTLIDLVRAVYREHPDWTARQIATHLDRPFNSVTTYLTQVRHEARRAAQREAVEARPVVPAPTPARIPERPPVTPRAPVAAIPSGSGSAVITKPMARAPGGTRFWLRNEAGLYLHYGCENLTSDRRYAWSGSQEQMFACRRKYPLARDLIERVVEKEPSRVEA